MCNNTKEEDIVEKWGLPLKELYTLALKFFKGMLKVFFNVKNVIHPSSLKHNFTVLKF